MSYRLLHFADLHLDAPFAWASPETARLRRQNRREALRQIVELARSERVDAILCAGDLFEHERFSPDTIEFLRTVFGEADLPIYLAPGNHDWYSARSPYALADWPANVYLFTDDRLTRVELADGLSLWGAAHRAPANTDGFFDAFRVTGGGVHLALVHASERGALGWQEAGKQPHSPFDAAQLEASGLHHAFLGHYHVPKDAARYTYPGNPDPLEFGEEGERGAVLASILPNGEIERERFDVAVSAVHDVRVPMQGARHSDEVRQRLAEALAPLSGCVRATLVGEVAPSVELDLRELSRLDAALDGLVLRSEVVSGYDLATLSEEATVRGQFVRDADGEITDDGMRRRVVQTGLRALEGRSDLEVA